MKKRYIVCLACYCSLLSVSAQDIPGKKYRFHSVNSFALVNGDNAASAALQTVNGFSKGALFAGLGAGLDYYEYRTIPVFADLRYEFGKKRTKAFVYGDGGINFNWVQDYFYIEPSIWSASASNDFKHGLYTDIGIGLSAGMKNGNAVILSLGYSRKTMKETITHQDWRTRLMQTDVNTYRFNRVIFKLGFRFF
jgi:hypothetical protein